MNISIDYDNTYTRDPILWNVFIANARGLGHMVYCVTMRSPAEGVQVFHDLTGKVDNIYFTNRQAKKDFMYEMGIAIDVWIDDMPLFVIQDAADRTYFVPKDGGVREWHDAADAWRGPR
jgi:hypothetical protein